MHALLRDQRLNLHRRERITPRRPGRRQGCRHRRHRYFKVLGDKFRLRISRAHRTVGDSLGGITATIGGRSEIDG